MDIWVKGDFRLRGNISSTGRGSLKLEGFINSDIESTGKLEVLYALLTGENLPNISKEYNSK